MMDDDDLVSVSGQSEISEYTHLIFTVWQWNEDQITQLQDSWKNIERRNRSHDVRISFIREKQAFEIKASYDNIVNDVRNEFFELLREMSKEAKPVFTVPRKARKTKTNKNKRDSESEEEKLGKPPPLDDDDDGSNLSSLLHRGNEEKVEKIFQFSYPIGNVEKILRWNRENYEPDAWTEISKQCKVTGDLVPYKKRIYFTGGEKKDIEMAIRRLKTLEEIYNRKPVKNELSLVHHPNSAAKFKLCFLKLEEHAHFSKVFRIGSRDPSIRDPYIIVPAIKHSSNKKWMILSYGEKDTKFTVPDRDKNTRTQDQKQDDFDSYNWPAIELPKTQTPWADSPSAATFSSESPERLSPPTREQKNAREEPKKFQRAEARRNRAMKFGGAENTSNSGTSSAWNMTSEPPEERIHDEELMGDVPTKPMIWEKNPNSSQNIPPHGIAVRDYNFSQMKQALKPGFEYVRAHRGEVRFFGSLGKVFFTNVNEDISKSLWNFTDLKDIIIEEHCVKPLYHNFVTDSQEFSAKLADTVLRGKNSTNSPEEFSFFEICADLSNPFGNKKVFMYVDCAVSLQKVALSWDRHADIYWTIMDSKFDFAMNLNTRRYIRPDVYPFKNFMKRTAISPEQNVLTCENIDESLIVKSINFRTVTRYKLNYPYIAELTRIEPRILTDQPNTNKIVAKIKKDKDEEKGKDEEKDKEKYKVYWTLEIVNWDYEQKFKENEILKTGEIAEWTVDSVLGVEPMMKPMADYIKSMLFLVGRCNNPELYK